MAMGSIAGAPGDENVCWGSKTLLLPVYTGELKQTTLISLLEGTFCEQCGYVCTRQRGSCPDVLF